MQSRTTGSSRLGHSFVSQPSALALSSARSHGSSSAACCSSSGSARSAAPGVTTAPQRTFSDASLGAPKRSRGSSTRVASGAALAMIGGGGGDWGEVSMTSQIISTAVTTGVAAAAAWFFAGRQTAIEQDQSNNSTGLCPRCEGSRYEPCVCQRWSDTDDSGCASCSKTGYMPCRACRGGGTAVPIKARIYVPSSSSTHQGGNMRQMSSAAAAPELAHFSLPSPQ